MYMGATFALLGLLVLSLLFAGLGWLHYSPVSMIIGLAVLLTTSLTTNWAIGYLLRIRVHQVSAIITSLILFFIMSPPQTTASYVGLAAVAFFAMASKYVLAWRGRHIFNPAAAGAVIALLLTTIAPQLMAASWWVAAPPLFIPIVLFGSFLLYRTNRLEMGYIYIATGLIVSSIVTFMQSALTISSFTQFLTSYPILFLAYFMLSEPLTQAPRRWQRSAVAVIVAILASAQLSIGSLFVTPEIALLVGNLVAFMYAQRKLVRLRFDHSNVLANGQVAYHFTPLSKLQFDPGQYLELSIMHKKADTRGQRRMFTIASSPGAKSLRIITRHSPRSSTYKTVLHSLKKGMHITATGIYGDFLLPKNANEKILMIAGGIGITPFLSQLQSLKDNQESRDVTLLYFVKSKDDTIAIDELVKASEYGVKLKIVQQQASKKVIAGLVPDIRERVSYVSGSPMMVDAVKKSLKHLRPKRLVTDQFDGY